MERVGKVEKKEEKEDGLVRVEKGEVIFSSTSLLA